MTVKVPIVSVIISTMNDGKKLKETIKSFDEQDYEHKELIVIDGLSSDTTKNIIEEYSNIIKFYLSEKDKGIYDAWNKGIKNSNGDWVTFLGAGDRFFNNNTLSSLMQYTNYKNINFVSGIVYLEDRNGEFLGKLGKEWDQKALRNNINIAHPGSLHHKSLFKNHGNFNMNYKISGDYEFLLRVSKSIVAKFNPNFVVRMDNIGISNKKPFTAIYESAKAIYKSDNFSIYASLRYMIIGLAKTTIKYLLMCFPLGKKILQGIKRSRID